MRVIIEKEVNSHNPQLYQSDQVADRISGFEAVDDSVVKQFYDQGYLVISGGLDAKEVQEARDNLTWMTRASDPRCGAITYEGAIREHINMAHAVHQNIDGDVKMESISSGEDIGAVPDINPELRAGFVRRFGEFTGQHAVLGAIASKRAMLDVITRLIKEPVKEFQDMALIKPPNGREKPWHQDHAYFNLTVDTPIMGVWIALDNVTPENGCMYLLSGAHKEGPRAHFLRRDWQICDAEMMGCESVCAPMEAGDVMLFDGKLPHGTPINRSNDYRWALQFHYIPSSADLVDEQVRLDAFGNEGKGVTC